MGSTRDVLGAALRATAARAAACLLLSAAVGGLDCNRHSPSLLRRSEEGLCGDVCASLGHVVHGHELLLGGLPADWSARSLCPRYFGYFHRPAEAGELDKPQRGQELLPD